MNFDEETAKVLGLAVIELFGLQVNDGLVVTPAAGTLNVVELGLTILLMVGYELRLLAPAEPTSEPRLGDCE